VSELLVDHEPRPVDSEDENPIKAIRPVSAHQFVAASDKIRTDKVSSPGSISETAATRRAKQRDVAGAPSGTRRWATSEIPPVMHQHNADEKSAKHPERRQEILPSDSTAASAPQHHGNPDMPEQVGVPCSRMPNGVGIHSHAKRE